MILENGHSTKYLQDYLDGKIAKGLGLDIPADENLVWKRNQLNIILGHDNVGKTYWILWYFLALSTNHGLKHTIFMDENSSGKAMRDLIQIASGKHFSDLTHKELRRYEIKCENYFKFIDNTQRYAPEKMLDLFAKEQSDNYLIDPFNALDTPFTYAENYKVLNEIKMFTKKENSTIFINAHPASASGRRNALYPKGHDWEGYVQPPLKSDIEGGKPFNNKADDFYVIHRLLGHPTMWNFTMVDVVKVKDTDTGGKPTANQVPIMFDYNYGKGFTCGGVDAIKRNGKRQEVAQAKKDYEPKQITMVSKEFDTPKKEVKEQSSPNGIIDRLAPKDEHTPF